MVGYGTSCRVVGDHAATIIFGVLAGEARWVTSSRELRLTPGAFLVTGPGPERTLVVDSHSRVTTLQVTFRESPQSGSGAREEGCAHPPAGMDVDALTGVWPADSSLGLALGRVAATAVRGPALAELEAAIDELTASMRRTAGLHRAAAERIPAVRPWTRREILRQVSAGRDFMESHLVEHLTLRRIARAAAMSPFHFHRAFVQVFRQTPHQYVTQRRLLMAKALLAWSDMPVAEVAYSSGFGSTTTFSSAFRRHLQTSPSAFRRSVDRSQDAQVLRLACLSGR